MGAAHPNAEKNKMTRRKTIALIRRLARWAAESRKRGESQAAWAYIAAAKATWMTLKGELE